MSVAARSSLGPVDGQTRRDPARRARQGARPILRRHDRGGVLGWRAGHQGDLPHRRRRPRAFRLRPGLVSGWRGARPGSGVLPCTADGAADPPASGPMPCRRSHSWPNGTRPPPSRDRRWQVAFPEACDLPEGPGGTQMSPNCHRIRAFQRRRPLAALTQLPRNTSFTAVLADRPGRIPHIFEAPDTSLPIAVNPVTGGAYRRRSRSGPWHRFVTAAPRCGTAVSPTCHRKLPKRPLG